jgi:hypothetical protein
MKSILLIFIPLFILFSCHAPKNVIQRTKVDQQTKVDQNVVLKNEIADTKKDQTDAAKSVKDHSEGTIEWITKTVTYDTDKPTDPKTGKPPVKSESIITERNSGLRDIQSDTGIKAKKEETHKDNSKTETATNGQVNTSQKVKLNEKVKSPAVKYWLWILVIVIGSAVGLVIYWKWTKIKLFFKKLNILW